MSKTKKAYVEHLNKIYDANTIMKKTEHLWAGNDKTEKQKHSAWNMARRGEYRECLKKYDPIAFQVGFNEWKL